jgi:hypothetical protein
MSARQGDAGAVCLVKHDVSGLPVADTLRVTEDAVEKPLAKVGLVGTVTRLRGFRQDVIDERAGVAVAQVVVEETGAPVLLVVRLKVVPTSSPNWSWWRRAAARKASSSTSTGWARRAP